ncbi:hypothetical protein AGLY_011205, partial [Aphis glycines]
VFFSPRTIADRYRFLIHRFNESTRMIFNILSTVFNIILIVSVSLRKLLMDNHCHGYNILLYQYYISYSGSVTFLVSGPKKFKKKYSRAIHFILFTNVVFQIFILILNCNRGPNKIASRATCDLWAAGCRLLKLYYNCDLQNSGSSSSSILISKCRKKAQLKNVLDYKKKKWQWHVRFNCTSALKYGIVVSKGSVFRNPTRDKKSKLKLTR